MKKKHQNFLIDSLSFVCFVFLTSTGVIMHFLLPPGSGRWQTIWGMDRHEWGTIHFWIAAIFMGMLVIHLLLHFSWVVNILKGRSQEYSGIRWGLGLIGLLAVLAIAIAPLVTGVETESATPEQGHRYMGGRK